MPFLVVLIFWLTIIFGSFGLFAKPSATVFGSGLMQISSAPLRSALTPLSP
jgi:hypothetical protein